MHTFSYDGFAGMVASFLFNHLSTISEIHQVFSWPTWGTSVIRVTSFMLIISGLANLADGPGTIIVAC